MEDQPKRGSFESEVALLEAFNGAVYVLQDERFIYVNRPFTEMFGWSKEALLEASFSYDGLVSDTSRPLIAERARRRGDGEPLPQRYEFRAVRRDGLEFDVQVSVSYFEHGGRPAVLGVIQDISAQKNYERTLLRKNHELSVLNAIAEAASETQDLSAILHGLVQRLIELLVVDAAGIVLIEPGARRFASVHYRGASETFVREMRTRDAKSGVIGLSLRTKEVQVIEDIQADPRIVHQGAIREGFRSAVSCPLITGGQCIGVATIFTRDARRFEQADLELFVAIGRHITRALENARLYKKAREGIARLQTLSELARALGSTLEVEGVFRILGERLMNIVPYRRVCLNILHPEGQHFSVRTID